MNTILASVLICSLHIEENRSLFARAPWAGFAGGLILSLSWQISPGLLRHSSAQLCSYPHVIKS